MSDLTRLVDQLDIVDIVSESVDLKKSGSNYKGLCPFHSESTPSFIVSPSKGIFKCFGCGEGGDALTFFMKKSKLPFIEAVEQLAKRYRVDITFNRKKDKRDYSILKDSATFFREQLFADSGRRALQYLKDRGFTEDFAYSHYLGYAPSSGLYKYLSSLGYKREDILHTGLVKDGSRLYEPFGDRVMFTIFNSKGDVIGFGGRTLGSREPKYLNSPESKYFKKGYNLYGIFDKKDIRLKEYAILVEGYTDVLSCRAHGINNSVASLGTAFTDNQAELLKKLTNNVVIFYDSDRAGIKAAERAIFILKKAGFSVKVVSDHKVKDPDELLNREGVDSFKKLIKESVEAFDFLYNYYSTGKDRALEKKEIVNSFKPFFHILNDLEREIYLGQLSEKLSIDRGVLRRYLVSDIKKSSSIAKVKDRYLNNLELETLILLLYNVGILSKLKGSKAITNSKISLITTLTEENISENIKTFLESCGYNLDKLPNINSTEAVEELLYLWQQKSLEDDLGEIEESIGSSSKMDVINKYYKKRVEMERNRDE